LIKKGKIVMLLLLISILILEVFAVLALPNQSSMTIKGNNQRSRHININESDITLKFNEIKNVFRQKCLKSIF